MGWRLSITIETRKVEIFLIFLRERFVWEPELSEDKTLKHTLALEREEREERGETTKLHRKNDKGLVNYAL